MFAIPSIVTDFHVEAFDNGGDVGEWYEITNSSWTEATGTYTTPTGVEITIPEGYTLYVSNSLLGGITLRVIIN